MDTDRKTFDEIFQELIDRNKLWRTDPEEATRRFKDELRSMNDPSDYLSPFFIDILDYEDINYIREWKETHEL